MSYLADARFAHNCNCYNGYFIGCLHFFIQQVKKIDVTLFQ